MFGSYTTLLLLILIMEQKSTNRRRKREKNFRWEEEGRKMETIQVDLLGQLNEHILKKKRLFPSILSQFNFWPIDSRHKSISNRRSSRQQAAFHFEMHFLEKLKVWFLTCNLAWKPFYWGGDVLAYKTGDPLDPDSTRPKATQGDPRRPKAT